ncbi:MAG: ABC transporter permease subunit [Oscillospiraceae bacterium]|nr:ABC transporter permease subunit [Oscillospiraceae bacterium]
MQNIDRGFAGMKKEFKKNGVLYLIVLPVIIYYFIFHYMPLYGLLMAFQDFSPRRGIMGSEWVGLTHFINFFKSPDCARIVTNTLRISLSCLLFEFPAPIIMAILINELNGKYFKRTIQTISYLPHFISLVVICGMIKTFVEADGIIGGVFSQITGNGSSMLSQSKMFLPIYVISNIWQSMGWESIIYLAALMNIDPQLYEAADIDGAGKLAKIWKITLPSIAMTIVTMFILRVGKIMSVGYEKIILLYNPAIYDKSDVISSFVFRIGFTNQNWSYSAAIGLFNSVVNMILLLVTNTISKKMTDTGLW